MPYVMNTTTGLVRKDPEGVIVFPLEYTTQELHDEYITQRDAGIWLMMEHDDPTITVPEFVSNAASRVILSRRGLIDQIENFINEDTTENGVVLRAYWEYHPNFYRNSGMVSVMKGVLGMNDAQIDELFIEVSRYENTLSQDPTRINPVG